MNGIAGVLTLALTPCEDAAGQGRLWDLKTAELMGTVLDAETSQLVVLNGDLISGDQYQGADILDHIDRIVKPIVKRNLPWASTYGNHDSNYNLDRDQMYKRETKYSNSYTQNMVDDKNAGVTNYYLPVYGHGCDDSKSDCVPEMILWFFDSRGGMFYRTHTRQPNWVDSSVVDWFKATNSQLTKQYGKVVPSLAFVHIPPHITLQLQKDAKGGPFDLEKHPGINDDVINGQSHGWDKNGTATAGKVGYGGHDMPFMEALVETKGLVGVFYGHDHGNTWCYKWKGKIGDIDIDGPGLNLCYGQHAGYGGYGNWIRGGRHIAVTLDQLKKSELDTHIRLETGDVVGAVTLNSTFNDDKYTKTPDTRTMMSLSGKSTTPSSGTAKWPAVATAVTACLATLVMISLV